METLLYTHALNPMPSGSSEVRIYEDIEVSSNCHNNIFSIEPKNLGQIDHDN